MDQLPKYLPRTPETLSSQSTQMFANFADFVPSLLTKTCKQPSTTAKFDTHHNVHILHHNSDSIRQKIYLLDCNDLHLHSLPMLQTLKHVFLFSHKNMFLTFFTFFYFANIFNRKKQQNMWMRKWQSKVNRKDKLLTWSATSVMALNELMNECAWVPLTGMLNSLPARTLLVLSNPTTVKHIYRYSENKGVRTFGRQDVWTTKM